MTSWSSVEAFCKNWVTEYKGLEKTVTSDNDDDYDDNAWSSGEGANMVI